MDTKKLIQENNQKRELLTKNNKKYYEDMLIYVRLSFNTSEHETEEALSEILDHLIEAQEDGKTAAEVFGDQPKNYAKDIIGALPNMFTKERVKMILMGIFYFLAAAILFDGVIKLGTYFIFDKGALEQTYYTGTLIVKFIVFIPVSLAIVYLMLRYFQWSCFRHINKILEFFVYWIFGILIVGLFMLLIYVIPDFGPTFAIPSYFLLIVGLIFYFAGRWTKTGKLIGA